MFLGFDGFCFSYWYFEICDDGVVVFFLDCQDSSVNVMLQDVLLELGDLFECIVLDLFRGVVVQLLKKVGFIVGVDLKEFQEFDCCGIVNDVICCGQVIYQKLVELFCFIVVVIYGYCLGGGIELVLVCCYCVVFNDSSICIGLLEIQLGIFLGWGGSVCLLQLVGVFVVMDMMLIGCILLVLVVCGIGLVDKVVVLVVVFDIVVVLVLFGIICLFKQCVMVWVINIWLVCWLLVLQMVKQVVCKVKKDQYLVLYVLISIW